MYSDSIKKLIAESFDICELAHSTGPVTCWLKQIRVDQLDNRSKLHLEECFPGFTGQAEVSNFYHNSAVQFEFTKDRTLRTKTGRLRRFAGDETLPGGRYHSLCSDGSGNDRGTLVWELMSYWTHESRKFPELIDSTVHIPVAKKLRESIPNLDGPFLMLKSSNIEQVSETGITLGDSTAVILPLTIQEKTFSRVVDLRLPVIQDFFSRVFGRLEAEFGMAGNFSTGKSVDVTLKKPPVNFKELLPTLLSPKPGGSTFLDAIGAICRNSGCEGLIFPSARLDIDVEFIEEVGVSAFSGWNLVDYRNAPYVEPTVILELLGRQVQWLRPYDVGIQIQWEQDKKRTAWKAVGAETGERQRYSLEWLIMSGQKQLNPTWDPWFVARRQG